MDAPAYHYEMTLTLIKAYVSGTSVDEYLRCLRMTDEEIRRLKIKLSNRYTNFALIADKQPGEVSKDQIACRVRLCTYSLNEMLISIKKRYAFCTMPFPPYKYEDEGILLNIFQYRDQTKLHFETMGGILKINPMELLYIEEI